MKKILVPLAAILLVACSESPKFKLMDSSKTGIDFQNTITETDSFHIMSYEYIYNGAGVGVGDLNNDGLQDLVFAGNQVNSRVYLNLGNFRFRDITANFEGLTNKQWFSGVTVADFNNDGLPDIYLTATASNNPAKCRNRLWINQGISEGEGPMFKEMSEQYGVAEQGQSVNAAVLDYDLDGDLDLYVLNNTLTQRMNTSYRAKIVDGSAGNNDQLYRNNGDGTFTNVTREAGILIEGFGLGLAIGDVNKDGYPDIYVSNDYISNDLLYINQKNGTFRNEIAKYMAYQTKSSMGDDMADINNDGNPDMYTLDMMPEEYSRKKQTINGFSYIFYVNDDKYGYEHQYLRNMLQVHNGFLNGEMLPYSEAGQYAGIFQTEWSWSPLFADYDNDGDKDLIISNGYPKDLTDKDWTFYKVKVFGFIADEKHVIEMAPSLKVQNYAYENTGNLKFVKRSAEWLPKIPSYSYGASFVDLDNDGDLDYVCNNLNDKAFVLKNTTMEKSGGKRNYIRIKLVGKDPNRFAIGAKTEVWTGGSLQFNEHFLTRGYASSVDPIVHFGTGTFKTIDSIKITWPKTGNVTVLRNVKSNQLVEISEEGSLPSKPVMKSTTKTLFTRVDSVLDYTHTQKDFIDFFYDQTIIPHKFSQIGPVLATGDINGDKKVDILVGSTNSLPTTLFINNGKGFTRTEADGLTTTKPFSEGGLSIVDIDNDGDNDVLAIAGGYENQDEKEYKHMLYRNENGKFKAEDLPVPEFTSSVIRPFDFDHDGDADIFIGSRVKKSMFPYANHSWVLTNNNGQIVADTTFRLNLGLVTDAVWSDFDGDGWEDLVVTREWNSVAFLKNINGKKLEPVVLPGIESKTGIWYSIAAGDFDQDGDNDYVIGNLGENNRYTLGEKYPLSLYVIDLDLDGKIDPIITAYYPDEKGKMAEYPLNYFDELRSQTEYFGKVANNYTEFSFLTINDMIKPDLMKRLQFKLQVNTTSSYILWNDKGTFTWEKLPMLFQLAPLKRMIVTDLNGDKLPDFIAGGNDYTYDISTGYYASNKGIVMINKGGRNFELLTPSKSGLVLDGMVESLIWMDGQEPLVIAGINRNKTLVYRLNNR
ncbi:MAG: VCBS repeat-containing protein [Bacteroidales bacterium]